MTLTSIKTILHKKVEKYNRKKEAKALFRQVTHLVQKEQEIVKSLGGKFVSTNVSSNNVNQCKALLANGYTIRNINHVFVKHNM